MSRDGKRPGDVGGVGGARMGAGEEVVKMEEDEEFHSSHEAAAVAAELLLSAAATAAEVLESGGGAGRFVTDGAGASGRGNYKCSRCGQPKKGHKCVVPLPLRDDGGTGHEDKCVPGGKSTQEDGGVRKRTEEKSTQKDGGETNARAVGESKVEACKADDAVVSDAHQNESSHANLKYSDTVDCQNALMKGYAKSAAPLSSLSAPPSCAVADLSCPKSKAAASSGESIAALCSYEASIPCGAASSGESMGHGARRIAPQGMQGRNAEVGGAHDVATCSGEEGWRGRRETAPERPKKRKKPAGSLPTVDVGGREEEDKACGLAAKQRGGSTVVSGVSASTAQGKQVSSPRYTPVSQADGKGLKSLPRIGSDNRQGESWRRHHKAETPTHADATSKGSFDHGAGNVWALDPGKHRDGGCGGDTSGSGGLMRYHKTIGGARMPCDSIVPVRGGIGRETVTSAKSPGLNHAYGLKRGAVAAEPLSSQMALFLAGCSSMRGRKEGGGFVTRKSDEEKK